MIESAVIHSNFRAHANFNDGSSLILHPGYEHFTYFASKDCKKHRGFTLTAVPPTSTKIGQLIGFANSVIESPVPLLAE
jgi:hypothetical protein